MISRSGDRVPPGDGAGEVDRRTVGTDAPDTGTARIVIGMASLNLALLCVVLAFTVTHNRDGLLVLATIFGVTYAWAAGAFSSGFWSR